MLASAAESSRIAGRFVLESIAGSGGMGTVYRAHDEDTGQTVAVKLIQATGKPHETERFILEADLLAKLRHPGIVGYLAHGVTEAGEPYLAMEWLEGEDLSQRLARGELSLSESLVLLRRVAEPLALAHEHRVVHRDLKPSNLFLRDGQVEHVALLDFGIARLTALSHVMTRTGMVVGTPGYMAPEQARGERDVTPAADVFSLGCVIFECLTGQAPFAADHVMAVLARICFDEPPKLRRVRPEMPEAVEALLGRMLVKSPAERLPDAAAVLAALDALDEVRPVAAPLAPSAGGEQQLLSVLMATPPAGTYAALGSPDSTIEDEQLVELHREIADFGARLEVLVDGSLVATLQHARGAATDQATRAAQCALVIRARWPGATIAVGTGRGFADERGATGKVFDRAAALVRDHTAAPRSEQILIDDVTRGLLEVRFVVHKTPSGVYALTGEELALDASRPLLGKPTPCVGRDAELATLEDALRGCIEDGEPRAVLVTAPPGAGKSRLRHEFLRRVTARGEDLLVLIGRGDPMSTGSSYSLLGQAVRRLCGILDGESLEARREKLSQRIGERIPAEERERAASFIGELSGVPFADADNIKLRAARQDPLLMNDQITQAMLDFLHAECRESPLLLVLEDLHWGDALTAKLCEAALRKLTGCPLMVLALARPEVDELFPRLWSGTAQVVPLRPLGKKAGERLVQQVLGSQVTPETVARIVEQSEGNALFLEELIRAVAEGKGDEAPETVLAILQARIGRLDAGERQVLRAASVFGETAWLGGIQALLGGGGPSIPVQSRLLGLVEREVLVQRPESRFVGEVELAFRHVLLREGAYTMLTDDDRTLGHKLAGEWLLDHGEADPMALAGHFERGGQPARAAEFYLSAAQQVWHAGDGDTAKAHVQRGLECDVEGKFRMALLGLLCENSVWRNESSGEAVRHAEEVMRMTAPGSASWVQAAVVKMSMSMKLGRMDEFMATLADMQRTDPFPDAVSVMGFAFNVAVYVLDLGGQVPIADAVLQRFHEVVAPVVAREPLASAYLQLAHGLRVVKEDPWSALQATETMSAEFERAQFHRGKIGAPMIEGLNLWALGALAEAERSLNSLTRPDEEVALLSSVRPFVLAASLMDRGALDEALLEAAGLVEAGRARRLPMDEGRGRWALAEGHRRRGDHDAAEREALAAVELLRAAPLDHIPATATLAAVRLAQGRTAEALAAAQDALTRYETVGACGMFRGAYVRLVHAECLYAAGDHEAARIAIAKARERIVANAAKIGDAGYQRSFLESVPENVRTFELARQWLSEEGDRDGFH